MKAFESVVGCSGARFTVSLGILFNVKVQVQDGVVIDPNIRAYELLIEQFGLWLIGPRKFAGVFCAQQPQAILGDHYNDHLWEKGEFHVPIKLHREVSAHIKVTVNAEGEEA